MNSAIERLLSLRVTDVMSRNIVSISSYDTMNHAAHKLQEHSISGAPVVDEGGEFAGVLTAVDFMKKQDSTSEGIQEIGCRDGSLVCQYMTTDVQSITAQQPLLIAARLMCHKHIHRLPVLDERGGIAGIVTALDIVAAVVNAIDQ